MRTVRFTLLAAMVPLAMSSGPVPALAMDRFTSASAVLHPIEGSRIRARIELIDRGNPVDGLVVRGIANGLDPKTTYLSLVYDAGSTPGGPSACLPEAGGDLNAEEMFLGIWIVDPAGNGTLFVTKTGPSYVALSRIGTISVRESFDRSLKACGRVHPAP